MAKRKKKTVMPDHDNNGIFKKEMKKKNGTGYELTTVRGIVIPVDWDDEGNALAVAILGPGEKEHFVEQDEKGKELLELLRQEIEVSGVVRKAIQDHKIEHKIDHKIIAVKSYWLKTGGD